MSLILDALKKLERDKDSREPNVLVVGSVPWGSRARSRLPLVAVLVAAVVVAVAAFALWPRGRAPRPPMALPSVASPSPVASSPGAAATPPGSGSSEQTTRTPAPSGAAPAPRQPGVSPEVPAAVEDEAAEGAGALDEAAIAPPTSRRGSPGSEELRLNAISERDGRRVALINDRLVFEGDGFDGVKVLRIGESEVEVEVRGVKRVLRF